MTQAQFDAALLKYGMAKTFMGYVTVWRSPKGGSLQVHPLNAGTRRRSQLAYLIAEQTKAEDDHAARSGGAK
jgi:hypothetical protein